MAKKKKYLEALQEAYGIEPTSVRGIANTRTEYYYSQLERLAFSIIDVDYNEELYRWDKDYIREALLIKGVFTVTNDNSGNTLPLKCGVAGYNVFNRATTAIIANPVVGSFNRTIGKDCELVYLQSKFGSRFRSLQPILTVFSQKLANCDAGIDTNLFNSRTAMIFRATSANVAESYKAMYDEIAQGNPAVFVDEDLGNLLTGDSESNLTVLDAKNNFVADLIQNEKMSIINEFLTAIGINSANTTKRERLITNEVDANNVEIQANIKLWKQNVTECVARVNKMFPDVWLRIEFPFYDQMESDGRLTDDWAEERSSEDESI